MAPSLSPRRTVPVRVAALEHPRVPHAPSHASLPHPSLWHSLRVKSQLEACLALQYLHCAGFSSAWDPALSLPV